MQNRREKMRKAGLILQKTAKDCLMELCYQENEAQQIIERGNLSEIERLTGVVSILDGVIHGLCPVLVSNDKIVPPRSLFSTLIYSDEPEEELRPFLHQLARCSEPRKAELIIIMLKMAHDEWIKLHEDVFFDPGMQYLQGHFMPLELIGFTAAKWYFTYIERLVDFFGWVVDEKLVSIAYQVVQDGFCLQHQLCSNEQLMVYLANAEYEALSPRIKKALKGNYELARVMARA